VLAALYESFLDPIIILDHRSALAFAGTLPRSAWSGTSFLDIYAQVPECLVHCVSLAAKGMES